MHAKVLHGNTILWGRVLVFSLVVEIFFKTLPLVLRGYFLAWFFYGDFSHLSLSTSQLLDRFWFSFEDSKKSKHYPNCNACMFYTELQCICRHNL